MSSALGLPRPGIPSGSASYAGHTQQQHVSNNNLGSPGYGQPMSVAPSAVQQAPSNGFASQQFAQPQTAVGYDQQSSQIPKHAQHHAGPVPGQSAPVTPGGLHPGMSAADGFPRSVSAQDGRTGGIAQQLSQMHIANQALQPAPVSMLKEDI